MSLDLTGTEIFGYEIVRLLGEGGMATVWLARHPDLDREMAIKVLNPVLMSDPDLVDAWVSQAVSTSKRTSRRVVPSCV